MDYEGKNTERFQSAMSRPCKVFISIDQEGLLFDAVSISDVANFDCYESIMKSAQRIIAMFYVLKLEEVTIDRLFYYKRRARSMRMNPVPLLTTTDGFRAVAEHPSGEVPIGVHWTKIGRPLALKKPTQVDAVTITEVKIEIDQDGQVVDTQEVDDDSPAQAVKRRKIDLSKTYMPSPIDAKSKPTSSSDSPASVGSETPSMTYVVPMPTSSHQSISTHPTALPTVTSIPKPTVVYPAPQMDSESMAETSTTPSLFGRLPKLKTLYPDDLTKRPTYASREKTQLPEADNSYHFPGHTSCEVVFHYEGISERKKVPQPMERVIKNLVNQVYIDMRPEVARNITTHLNASKQAQLNNLNNSTVPEPEEKESISDVRDAKFEIYKILSLLCLSKRRFEELLKWMRSLKLEEGNQGKFYLSERNVVGGSGLRVAFDSDAQAGVRFQSLLEAKQHKRGPVVLYPSVHSGTNLEELTGTTPRISAISGQSLITSSPLQEKSQPQVLLSSKPGAPPPGKVMLSDGTLLVPVPGKQIKASDLTNRVPLAVTKTNSESAKRQSKNVEVSVLDQQGKGIDALRSLLKNAKKQGKLTADPIKDPMAVASEIIKQTPILAATLTGNTDQPANDPVPLRLFRSYRTNDGESAENDDGTGGIKLVIKKEKDEDRESPGSDSTLDADLTPYIKMEPTDYNSDETADYDQSSRLHSPLTDLDIPGDLSTDADADKTEFDYVIKTEPLDDFDIENT